jgi:hypothetical protein
VRYYDDDDVISMMRSSGFDDLVGYFNAEPKGMYRSDIARLLPLYVHGGVYYDNDSKPGRSLREMLEAVDFVSAQPAQPVLLTVSTWAGILNAFYAVTPRHPAVLETIEVYREWYQNSTAVRKLCKEVDRAWRGPCLYAVGIARYYNLPRSRMRSLRDLSAALKEWALGKRTPAGLALMVETNLQKTDPACNQSALRTLPKLQHTPPHDGQWWLCYNGSALGRSK